MEKKIDDLYAKFPHCQIPSDVALPQKLNIIVARAKDLEETIQKMDVEHKACIVELEARTPGTPPKVREAQVEEIRGYVEMVETHVTEAQQLLNEASHTWANMEDIDGLVEVR